MTEQPEHTTETRLIVKRVNRNVEIAEVLPGTACSETVFTLLIDRSLTALIL